MKKLLITIAIFIISLFSLTFAEKKQWKQPQLKEGQTIQEAFEELRQNRNHRIEKRKQEVIQERKDDKRAQKASRSEIAKEKKEERLPEEKNRGFDWNRKAELEPEKRARRILASESQIDRLEPREFDIDFLEPRDFENILLAEGKDEARKNRKKEQR